ncbi:phosphodiester glycosidase family protein [uncultured Mailhella sp.]|uniref:phosphodiester glycosidase family protein n=1 Tax=uncultured Mailhella sp. TaxID=1981031 RepID=UPI0026211256|nr:phosphodiester glycosidase family protein [uncultured Mailhella sp.]
METLKHLVCLFFLALLLLAPVPCRAVQEPLPVPPGHTPAWLPVERGLELALLSCGRQQDGASVQNFLIRVLRIDTTLYDFVLCSARWESGRVLSIREWAAAKQLSAAVNASMYQADGLTSTGYMRSGEQTNNSRVVRRYGSFFVAGPRSPGLPRAAVLDRERDDWERLLPQYDIVVQNFRLMGSDGKQLWPENGPRHAVAAVAEDLNGRILFLHCENAVSVHDFVEALKSHSELNLNSAMYAEGGSEASLLLRRDEGVFVWTGLSPANYFSGTGDGPPLPSVLGAVPR